MRIEKFLYLKPCVIYVMNTQVKRNQIKYKDEDGKWKVTTKEFAKRDAGNRMLYFSETVKWTLMQIAVVKWRHGFCS